MHRPVKQFGFASVASTGVKGESYIENTINVHRFSFIAKKSLHALKVRERENLTAKCSDLSSRRVPKLTYNSMFFRTSRRI